MATRTTAIDINALRGDAMSQLCKIDDPDVLGRVVASLKRTIARVIDPPVLSQYEFDGLKEALAEYRDMKRRGEKFEDARKVLDEL